jgi:hypothetical protein
LRGRNEDTDTDAVYIKKVGLRKGVVVGLRERLKAKREKEERRLRQQKFQGR